MPLSITDRSGRTVTVALTGEGAAVTLGLADGGFLTLKPAPPSPFASRRAAALVTVSTLALAAAIRVRSVAAAVGVTAQAVAAAIRVRHGAASVAVTSSAKAATIRSRLATPLVEVTTTARAARIVSRRGAAQISVTANFEGVGVQPLGYDVLFGTTLADFTPGTVGAAIATRIDASGNGNTGTQIVTAARSVLRLDGSNYYEEFDGIDDRRQFAADASWRKAAMSVIMVARFNSATSGGSRVVFGGNNTYGVLYQGGSSSTTVSAAGFSSFYKNGSLLAGTITRDALYTAWVIDDWVILEAAGGDLSAAGFSTHFQYPGWRDDDNLAACDIADVRLLPTADADANRAAIVSELATKWGITL